MTFREKFEKQYSSIGWCGCPHDHGYEERRGFYTHCASMSCDDCWNREMEENESNPMKPQIGDTIKCHDKEELIRVMAELVKQGIYTDFVLEKNGIEGFWLVVERIEE